MNRWGPGYSKAELDGAQERYQLRFPPDLIDLFLDRWLAQGYAWEIEDHRIRRLLEWPLGMLLFDVEKGFRWPDRGDRPHCTGERREIVGSYLARKPRLIPLFGHRFLPESPNEAGNPVFSMYGFDTIYYGSNLGE
jgi:hypothetical protein